MQVQPDTPLEKAQKLVEKVLKDANSCRILDCTNHTAVSLKKSTGLSLTQLRDYAFKLRPISMSGDLIQQLRACSTKLGVCAGTLQSKIREKKNKNKHYLAVIAEAHMIPVDKIEHI